MCFRSVAVASIFATSLMFAQVETARIVGTVKDQSGALVPGAQVTMTNTLTGLSYRTVSKPDGSYESAPLRIGSYRVAAEQAGFKRAVREGIVLQIQQTAEVDLTMEVGEVTQEVSITAAAPLLTAHEATQGQVIDNQKIVDLPLNGRDYIQLALLSAGTSEPASGARMAGFSGNGMRSTQNNFLLDGVDNNNAQIAAQGLQSESVKPSVDSIQEFKVMTNSFSAEYGRAAGAVVNVTLKSGTNELHGTAFEFLRNEKLDAKNFFDLPASPKPAFKRNQFGFSAGGPIRKNKTFFFGNYEWNKIRESRTANNTIPTPLMLKGDFSELLPSTRIFDPASYDAASGTRTPFPGNVIPASRFDPIGAKIAALYPQPNKPGLVQNFLYNPPNALNRDSWNAKIDHSFGPNDLVYGRFSFQRDFTPPSLALPPPAYGAGTGTANSQTTTGDNFMTAWNHIFSPTFIISSKIGWNRIFTDIQPPVKTNLNRELGLLGVDTSLPGMSPFQPSGYTNVGIGTIIPNNAGSQSRQLISDVTWIHARHSVKFGISFSWLQSYLFNPQLAMGSFAFDGGYTRDSKGLREGNSIADLLLGMPYQAQVSNYTHMNQRSPFYDFYVQDEWKATDSVTLNFGLRYELHLPWVEKRNGWANFDLDSNPASPALVLAEDGSRYSRATIHTDARDFGPRFGFAWRPAGRTVVRGGYGLYYTQYEPMGGEQYIQTNPPFHYKASITTDRIHPTIQLSEGLPPDTVKPQNARNIVTSSYDRGLRAGYAHQWNFSVQREFPHDMLLEAGYYANSAHRLMRRVEGNWALPGPGVVNNNRRFRSILVPRDNVVIGPLANTWRHESSANSNFHSLQLRLEKRLSYGLSLLGSYIWSKAISDGRGVAGSGGLSPILPQNPLDLRAERALSDEHRPHRFVTSYVYDLPVGQGKAFLANMHPVMEAFAGGWSLAGIGTLESGRPVNLSVRGNPSNTGGPDRPNVLHSPDLGSSPQTLSRWFDTTAFGLNAPYTFGNAGRNILRGPGVVNFDLAVYKYFRITEGRRLQFRAEAFNAFNTPAFGAPNAQVGDPNFGIVSSAQRPRNLQMGLKFIF